MSVNLQAIFQVKRNMRSGIGVTVFYNREPSHLFSSSSAPSFACLCMARRLGVNVYFFACLLPESMPLNYSNPTVWKLSSSNTSGNSIWECDFHQFPPLNDLPFRTDKST